MCRMKEPNPQPGKAQPKKSGPEIPPPQTRRHLTEPSWIENMIYLAGLYLGQETEDESEEKPPKTEAA